MALLQITEPDQDKELNNPCIVVGIDLGTTNSLIAMASSDGVAKPIADEDGSVILPSVVRYQQTFTEVGELARKAAILDPLNTISSIKRLIGRTVSDLNFLGEKIPYQFVNGVSSVPVINTVQGFKNPIEISADIIKKLLIRVKRSSRSEIFAVVTVPAYFDDIQRQATKDAAILSGLKILRLLNEPTAAALAYGLDKQTEGIITVFDLGGGTFDISVLNIDNGIFEVLATGGDSTIGGDDFDFIIARWIIDESGLSSDINPTVQKRLLKIACTAKEKLTKAASVKVSFDKWSKELTRTLFNKLVAPIVKKIIKICRETLLESNIEIGDIKEVVMVGGSSRIPKVREEIAKMFGSKKLLTSIDPEQTVAIGAAIQARNLTLDTINQSLLLDVIPLSLGIETIGGIVDRIIMRNSTIPIVQFRDFTTYKDYQTSMMIHILQGENDRVTHCRSLSRFYLKNIPSMRAGEAKIRVTFQVDANSLLSVSARELISNVETSIQVKPSYDLARSDIEKFLEDS